MNDITGGWSGFMWTGVILGTLGAISSETWPCIWIIIELNLMSFLPAITAKWRTKKITILYFIVQRIGSLAILTRVGSDKSGIVMKWLMIGLLMKAALAPFHFWGPIVLVNLSKGTSFLLLTWQKVAPLFLLLLTTNRNHLICILLCNAVVSSICGIGAKDILVLLFFSRLSHMCWVMSAPYIRACKYFLLYSFSVAPIFLFSYLYIPILILNIAGLPPITGFLLKLGVIQMIDLRLTFVLLLSSVPLLFAYCRLFLFSVRKGVFDVWCVLSCGLGIIY